jgi:hypothetical protein
MQGVYATAGAKVTLGAYTKCMSNPKFEMGDRVENTKNKRIGFVKKQRSESGYLVSVQGFGECVWNEADMVKAEEPKNKQNRTYGRNT